ncbi:MAG TPA: amidohydrolase [Methylomirabilota bacterium]|jgi:predicted amidohydrolase YtcJ|nr:amidohydrolase [Methylomirabilota bacterium]
MPVHVPPGADLLLSGGRVLTLDPLRPQAEAVALASGKILAVGSEAELKPLLSPRTQILSYPGKTILPGFIDPHLHLFAWASRFSGIDLSPARSVADIQQKLIASIADVPAGEWVRGYGYDEFFLTEKRHPTRWDLDAVSTSHPILLRHRTGHAAVLNSAALQRAGIRRSLTPPPGGQIEYDPATGEPTGVLYELEAFLRTVLPHLPEQELKAGVRQANRELLRHGVTSFHDASAGNTLEDLTLFRRLHDEGLLTPRATVMLSIDMLPSLLASRVAPFAGDDYIRCGSLKIMLHESRSVVSPPYEEVVEKVVRAHREGFQVAFHAVEEGPISIALAALAEAQARMFRADHRHRIEHCALCPPPFIDLLADTGGAVVTQPGFLRFYGEKYATAVEPDVHSWLYRTKSLLARGVCVAGSSDCPVAPLAPLIGVSAAMTRRARGGSVINTEERLTLHEALLLFTAAGAWVGFEESRKGRIAPGMLADLTVLDGDITQTPPEEIIGLSVESTIIGGRVVWPAEG